MVSEQLGRFQTWQQDQRSQGQAWVCMVTLPPEAQGHHRRACRQRCLPSQELLPQGLPYLRANPALMLTLRHGLRPHQPWAALLLHPGMKTSCGALPTAQQQVALQTAQLRLLHLTTLPTSASQMALLRKEEQWQGRIDSGQAVGVPQCRVQKHQGTISSTSKGSGMRPAALPAWVLSRAPPCRKLFCTVVSLDRHHGWQT
mmetsp:Transcript_17507/g.37824  ORF Transcript_17507/g.37824 Transcript_17507/m.37824 type:complete len:201 (+) Transcript_17507:333-935(+)